MDGQPGRGGAAGSITVTVDPSAQPYLNVLKLSNTTGDGRPGATPAISVATVAPLW
jgi:hypothetical protein